MTPRVKRRRPAVPPGRRINARNAATRRGRGSVYRDDDVDDDDDSDDDGADTQLSQTPVTGRKNSKSSKAKRKTTEKATAPSSPAGTSAPVVATPASQTAAADAAAGAEAANANVGASETPPATKRRQTKVKPPTPNHGALLKFLTHTPSHTAVAAFAATPHAREDMSDCDSGSQSTHCAAVTPSAARVAATAS